MSIAPIAASSPLKPPPLPDPELDPSLRQLPGFDRAPKKVLDQTDFLKLLATQFAHQDPLAPKQDTEFIAQMASFSSIEQMNSLSKSLVAFTAQQEFVNAQGYLGKWVTAANNDGVYFGTVTAVGFERGQPVLQLGNGPSVTLYDIVSVRAQAPGAGTTPPPDDDGDLLPAA
jgi:flagellar basal-body rod modification protein FlgD